MCKRCNNLDDETIQIFENKRSMGAEGKMKIEAWISKFDHDPLLEIGLCIEPYETELIPFKSLKIRYCPFCGRDLREVTK